MADGDLARDRESEPNATSIPAPRLVQPREPLEHPLPIGLRNPGAVVVDLQHDLGRRSEDPYDDLSGRMLGRVVDQVAHQAIQLLLVAQYRRLLDGLESEGRAVVESPGQVPSYQLGKVDGGLRRARFGVQPGDQQEVVGQFVQSSRLVGGSPDQEASGPLGHSFRTLAAMKLLSLVAALAAAFALLTPSGAPRAPGEDEIRSVLMYDGVFLFGDSIAVQDSTALERNLLDRTGDSIAMDNKSRRRTRETIDVLETRSRTYGLPGRIVLAVGSNDVFDPTGFTAQVDRALRIAGPDRTVYWVNVYVRGHDSASINQQLAAAQTRYPNLRIIPWSEFLTTKPARLRTYLRDGVHTTVPLGQDARNELIVSALTQRG